jgi:4'-phosphopantetheinyl transferase
VTYWTKRLATEDQVHLWFASIRSLSACHARIASVLSPSECDRRDAYRHLKDQVGFAVGRGVLRILLGLYLGEPPERIALEPDCPNLPRRSRKPSMVPLQDGRSLAFSVSRSADTAMYAISHRAPVGVDIERVNSRFPWEPVSRSFLSASERAELGSLPSDERVAGFFRIWTRKEAVTKAAGTGLYSAMAEIEVSGGAGGTQEALRHSAHHTGRLAAWSLADVSPSSRYAAALATASRHTGARVIGRITADLIRAA